MITVTLDVAGILEKYGHLAEDILARMEEETEKLTHATHVFMAQEASAKLHSSRDQFMENFPAPDQIDPYSWEIKILGKKEGTNGGAAWLEDGIKSGFDMLPGLLASPKAKQGKNGKYIIVPFKHNKGASRQTPVQKFLADTIKKDLSKRNPKIPFGMEKNPDGTAKMGLLHKLNVDINMKKAPVDKHTGKPWQPSEGSGPLLKGLQIHQKEVKGKAVKDVLTFRTASESQSRKEIYPPTDWHRSKYWTKVPIMLNGQWNNSILPSILKDFGLE